MSVGTRIQQPARWRRTAGRAARDRRAHGQAIVEFAIAGTVFFMIVFGTIDFGRVVFTYAQLHNAVREGARYGKVHCGKSGWVDNTKNRVIEKSPTLGLATGSINVTAPVGCVPPTGTVRVQATTTFSAFTQTLLGISSITLTSSATVDVE